MIGAPPASNGSSLYHSHKTMTFNGALLVVAVLVVVVLVLVVLVLVLFLLLYMTPAPAADSPLPPLPLRRQPAPARQELSGGPLHRAAQEAHRRRGRGELAPLELRHYRRRQAQHRPQ